MFYNSYWLKVTLPNLVIGEKTHHSIGAAVAQEIDQVASQLEQPVVPDASIGVWVYVLMLDKALTVGTKTTSACMNVWLGEWGL